jgi:hypothetical protein
LFVFGAGASFSGERSVQFEKGLRV